MCAMGGESEPACFTSGACFAVASIRPFTMPALICRTAADGKEVVTIRLLPIQDDQVEDIGRLILHIHSMLRPGQCSSR